MPYTVQQIRDFLASSEFDGVCTGDFGEPGKPGGDDTMMYYIMNPEQCDQPEDARRQKEWWQKGCPKITKNR